VRAERLFYEITRRESIVKDSEGLRIQSSGGGGPLGRRTPTKKDGDHERGRRDASGSTENFKAEKEKRDTQQPRRTRGRNDSSWGGAASGEV